ELPNVPEDYVHRIGRTGRAGREGLALSLVCGEEKKYLADIERLLKRKLPRVVVEGYEPGADPKTAEPEKKPAGKRRHHNKPRNGARPAAKSSRPHRGKRGRRRQRNTGS